MTRRSESTITTSDGVSLRRITWLPDGEITGLVVLVHGLGEHVGRYDHVAAAFNAEGIALSGADHRGHGRSEGLRGHVDGFGQYTADLHRVVEAFQKEHPGLPTVMFGHSMGGLITLSYNLDVEAHGLVGFVVSNPQLGLAFEPPKIKALAGRLLSRLLPRLRLDNELNTADLSRIPEEVAKYENDPLVHRWVSTRWFTSANRAMERVNGNPQGLTAPVMFLLGDSDRICSAVAARDFAERVGTNAGVKSWPASYHEPVKDLDRDEYISTLVTWVKERLAG